MDTTVQQRAPLSFIKMHGLGNDFVIIDSRGQGPCVTAALARKLGDRNRGVGYDQLAEIHSPTDGGVCLDFWNADGTRAGACGNATRCVADLMMTESNTDALTITTQRGDLQTLRTPNGQISVNMGQPQLDWGAIPLVSEQDTLALDLPGAPAAVGMGNPHCIFFVPDSEAVQLDVEGPAMETHPMFPERANIEFAHVSAENEIRVRVWERGVGITQACGTGACAVAVAGHRLGLVGRRVRIVLDGGDLDIDWRADGVWMTGPTSRVFDAVLSDAFLEGC